MDGRRVLVTGAASGIGRATALAFAREGASVALLDRDAAGVSATADEIAAIGVPALSLVGDVTRGDDVATALGSMLAEWGHLDHAFNNAGVEGARGTIDSYDEDEFDRVLAVNLRGTFVCMQHELRAMIPRGFGSIVNMASAAGLAAAPQMPAYAASKGAVIQLSRAAALDHGPHGIRVNAVCPGAVRTPMQERLREAEADLMAADVPLGRTARADEIAAAVVWLCSDAASYVTGHAMVVDGGLLTQGPRRSVPPST